MEPLKYLLTKELIDQTGKEFQKASKAFDRKRFSKLVFDDQWDNRELKDRSNHIADCIRELLPSDYPEALDLFLHVVETVKDKEPEGRLEYWFYPNFIQLHGLDHPKLSVPALAKVTHLFSSEFAVRPFIDRNPKGMMKTMQKWSRSKDFHVRRLASEGCRPRLPWGLRLNQFVQDPSPILPILENLKNDPELYVRRSVANNLNDIGKDNQAVVLKLLRGWKKDRQAGTDWITGHALRSMVKAGNKDALSILGYPANPAIEIVDFALESASVKKGEKIKFGFDLKNLKKQKLMVDYVIHFMKSNGETAPKVFKLKKLDLAKGEDLHIEKQHSFVQINTRKYYPGKHVLELQINGESMGKIDFVLDAKEAY